MTPETTSQRAGPVSAAAFAAAEGPHDDAKLYTTVVNDLLEALSTLPADELAAATRNEPPPAGKPWDPAIAAAVEYACHAAHLPTPDWCDEPDYEQNGAITAGGDDAERARALHRAPAAYIRHGVFPAAKDLVAGAGRRPAVLQGDGPGLPEAAYAMRGAAAQAERWLRKEGLRGHVYLTRNGPVWFATNIHGHPKVMGPQPVARAFAESIPPSRSLADWVLALHEAISTDEYDRPRAWWSTPSLVITGASRGLALALAAGFADEIEPKRLERLTWSIDRRSVEGIDRLMRTVTGHPLSARMRPTIARAVARAGGQKLRAGTSGWTARWIAAAEKTLAEGGSPRTLLKRTRNPDSSRWGGGPRGACTELEADLASCDAPDTEHGRLWIRRSADRGTRLVLLERDDPALSREIEHGRDIAAAVLEGEEKLRRTPANADGPWSPVSRPGWTNIVGLATYMAGQAYEEQERIDIGTPRINSGRLQFDVPRGARPHLRGVIAVSEALSAETCEICGGKGDPVADADGRPAGCRCAGCRTPDARVLDRPWPDAPPPQAAGGDAEDPDGLFRRLESDGAAHLMRADDDAGRGGWAAHAEGWCGVVRAMFLTLLPEQEPRPDDRGHTPFRLGVMKPKWGRLRVESARADDYQQGVISTIELISGWTCENCGHPAEMRTPDYVRPECDDCWSAASADDHAQAVRHAARSGGPPQARGPDRYNGISVRIPARDPDLDPV